MAGLKLTRRPKGSIKQGLPLVPWSLALLHIGVICDRPLCAGV